MKALAGGYARARDVTHALDLLAQADGMGRVLAGGQSLIAAMNMRLSTGDMLVDISRIADLRGVAVQDGCLRIGALTRHADIGTDPLVATHAPLLVQAVHHIAHAAIRNRGTIGGSLAHADPAAEFPACVLVLGGTIHLQGSEGVRQVAAEDFFVDVFETAIEEGEILTAITLPLLEAGERHVLIETARRSGDYALAGLCVVKRAAGHRVTAFSVGPRPVLAMAAMERLDAGDTAGAVDALRAEIDPPSDTQASAAYRRHLAGVLLTRALHDLTGETA
ncbi:xanthine dehydrogenase family protein subunit M [Seohaeicola sp. SP36]|uniref:FAD binding domain-containing protein n=1 Tax=unclassified Seohaeicola TaxID=2641111 RepID=UPI00237B6773|nr:MULTISPECIES: xanthine dehydrogenase family protein subunit M [unclassified Seohaeicola]MDD9707703.1 xanthine dehydrogenase family protein subunit M [Seohaeicola sp. 4SK31]MDD9735945.1 xanthine dehydrogenase family protein subunit M [Seohaeicola sp. SP36]